MKPRKKRQAIVHNYGTGLEITSGVSFKDNIVVNPLDALADGITVAA